ncbi:hypothetical protein K449DRAFT_438818 [Hypoxylon sp. EC38]|nr:hypothetical protein K449DRAFT_438818 [Hypoxylon sp. EC38]
MFMTRKDCLKSPSGIGWDAISLDDLTPKNEISILDTLLVYPPSPFYNMEILEAFLFTILCVDTMDALNRDREKSGFTAELVLGKSRG